jgi:Fic family protein
MSQILIFVVGAVVVGIVMLIVMKEPKGSGIDSELIKKQAKEKEENKKRILEFFGSRGSVSNDEIQNLLGVSDATAERYLHELEQEGRIQQVGSTGSGVTYQLKR